MENETCCGYADIDENDSLSLDDVKRILDNHSLPLDDFAADFGAVTTVKAGKLSDWLGY